MKDDELPAGEIAVLGLARSGIAAARLLLQRGHKVYASDGSSSPEIEANAAALRSMGAAVDTGTHDLARIAGASMVVASPGIDPAAAPLTAARSTRRPVVSEVEIALRLMPATRVITVTGTNGKTTTTAIVGHLLRAFGADAVDAGNIGTAVSEYAIREQQPGWVALEMSSFQLHDTPGLKPDVGVLTNLTPDHLDRYSTAADYYADKALLFANASAESRWVLNADDDRVKAMTSEVSGRKYLFSTRRAADASLDDATGTLHLLGVPLMSRSELNLLGDHNVANALAAALAVAVADDSFRSGAGIATIAAALRGFKPLAHRLEVVGETNGVQWINDSKATNVSSTMVAVAGMRRPTILLLGGRHKGEAYTSLGPAIRRSVKKVIAYGEAAPVIESDLGGVVTVERLGMDFGEVMKRAHETAEPGDTVLLSPACSSYDMFTNYEERGAAFRQLAMGK